MVMKPIHLQALSEMQHQLIVGMGLFVIYNYDNIHSACGTLSLQGKFCNFKYNT